MRVLKGLPLALLMVIIFTGVALAGLFDLGGFVAKVDGATVSKKEFDETLDFTLKAYQQRFGVDFKDETNRPSLIALKKKLVEDLVRIQLIRNEANRQKISVSGAEVDSKFREMKEVIPPDQLEKVLKAQGVTEARLKEDIKQQLLFEKVIEAVTPGISVPDSKVREYYDKNVTQFTHPEQVKASHILVAADRSAMTGKARAELKDKALGILKRVKAGEDFASLAKQYSDDPGSKMRGGDLGYFDEKTMVPGFSKAAFSLGVGEISGLVETDFGYHIIKVTDRRPAGKELFETVKLKIREDMLQQARGAAFQKWLLETRQKAKVEIAKEYQFESSPTVVEPKK